MPEKRFKSERRKLTLAQSRRLREGQRWVEANKAQLTAQALSRKREMLELAEAMRVLRRERESRGLSLAEVARRCGIDKGNLSRLETDPYPNPTLDTVSRIAHALGVRLTIGIATA
jgi:DNA-binding phage protein